MNNFFINVKKETINEVKNVKQSNLNNNEKKKRLKLLNKIYKLVKTYNNNKFDEEEKQIDKYSVPNVDNIPIKNNIRLISNPNDIFKSMNSIMKPFTQQLFEDLDTQGNFYSQSSYFTSAYDKNGNRVVENKNYINDNGNIRDNNHTRITYDNNGNEYIENL